MLILNNMGQYNCKQCDCYGIGNNLEMNLQSNIQKVPDKSLHDTIRLPDHSLLSSSTIDLCYFQYDPNSIHSLIQIQSTWRGFIVRKQVEFLKKQFKTSFVYFSNEEVSETLTELKKLSIDRSKREPYIYKSGGIYVGSWRGGFREGSGIMIYRDSARYDGQWKYSRPSGRGRFTYTDGEVYDGIWMSYYVNPKEKINLINRLRRQKGSIPDGYCKIYTVWLWMKEQEQIQSFDSLEGSSLENTWRKRNESVGFLTGLFLNSAGTPRKITSVDAAQISEMSLSIYGSETFRSESDKSKTMDTYKETDESRFDNLDLYVQTLTPILSRRRR